jgi:hypothetical protein
LRALGDDADDDQVDSAGSGGSITDGNGTKTSEEVKEALSKAIGLTDSHRRSLVDLEMSLANNADAQKGFYWEVEIILFY